MDVSLTECCSQVKIVPDRLRLSDDTSFFGLVGKGVADAISRWLYYR